MPAALADSILQSVRGQRSMLIGLLRDLVESESPSSHPGVHDRIRNTLAAALEDVGFAAREIGAPAATRHLIAHPHRRRRGAPLQLVVGHYDTVWPIGTLAERPFRVEGNVVRGPGVFDMKGGLAQLLLALRVIGRMGASPSLTPVVFLNADEEIGSRTSTRHITRLARRARRALILEPALGESGALKTTRKGVGRFRITVHGRAAHAGLDPDAGASAILELSHVIQKLFAMNDAGKGISVNVGTVDGGIRPNVIAPHSNAVVDVRVPTVTDGERIERLIRALEPENPDIRLRVEGGIGRPSMEATPRNRQLWQQARSLGRQLGIELSAARAGGASDGNTTSQYTATLDGLGPVGDGAHAQHEFLDIERTLERAALLALLLLSPADAAEPQVP